MKGLRTLRLKLTQEYLGKEKKKKNGTKIELCIFVVFLTPNPR